MITLEVAKNASLEKYLKIKYLKTHGETGVFS